MEVKQIILIRTDLQEMKKGKMVSQGAHASVKCIENIINGLVGLQYINSDNQFISGAKGNLVMDFQHELTNNLNLQTEIKQKWGQWYRIWNEFCLYKKITLKVQSLSELMYYSQLAFINYLPVFIVKDAGLTQIEPNTYTASAFLGDTEIIDSIVKDLKLL